MTRLFESADWTRPRRSWQTLPVSLALHAAGGALVLSFPLLAPLDLPQVVPGVPLVFRPPLPSTVVRAADLPRSVQRRPAGLATGRPTPALAQPATQTTPSIVPDGLPAPEDLIDGGSADLAIGPGCTGAHCVAGLAGDGDGSGHGVGFDSGDGADPGPGRPLLAGREVTPPLKLHDVRPDYPELARRARVEGRVELACTIAPDGRVVEARAVSGPALLREAALAAVRQWRYRPTLVGGAPVAVLLNVTVYFRLGR
jgi:protein TonB